MTFKMYDIFTRTKAFDNNMNLPYIGTFMLISTIIIAYTSKPELISKLHNIM